jgi:hypothetical protein
MRMKLIHLFWVGVFGGVSCLGQGTAPSASPLAANPATKAHGIKPGENAPRQLGIETLKIASEQAGAYNGMTCDSDGNLYLGGEPDGVPGIVKLNAKGERLAVFQPNSADLKVDRPGSFSIAPDGDVYQLIWAHELSRYVFVYRSDGTLRSEIKLQPGFAFLPSRVAAFPSGALFVSAVERDHDPNNPIVWPYQGIFSSSGTPLKELTFEDDDKLRDMAASGDKRVVLPTDPSSNLAFAAGFAETGPDGNVYLMRRTSPAIFYAISPGGSVRRFVVDPGESDFMPSRMQMSGGKIAILFRKGLTMEEFLKVVDLKGHEIATYAEPVIDGRHALGPAFLCYADNPERFIFLTTTEDHKLGLVIAKPQ